MRSRWESVGGEIMKREGNEIFLILSFSLFLSLLGFCRPAVVPRWVTMAVQVGRRRQQGVQQKPPSLYFFLSSLSFSLLGAAAPAPERWSRGSGHRAGRRMEQQQQLLLLLSCGKRNRRERVFWIQSDPNPLWTRLVPLLLLRKVNFHFIFLMN